MKRFMRKPLNLIKLSLCLALMLGSCEKSEIEEFPELNASVHSLNTVKVTSTGLNFEAPDVITAGWNTFMYMNKTGGTHFFTIAKMPDGIGLEDYEHGVSEPFQNGMNYYRNADFDNAFNTKEDDENADGFGTIAAWYGNVTMSGGPGLISPGETAVTSVKLDPGTYIIECYVKTPDGVFHSYDGQMIKEITVVDGKSKPAKEIKADVSLQISSSDGINMTEDHVKPGNTTFEVNFIDQASYGNLLQHDVHLVRFDHGFNPEDKEILDYWINWFFVDFAETAPIAEGLVNPAPEGVTFLGGTQEIPAGELSYFSAVLTPGDYALISEIDDPMTLLSGTSHVQFYHEFTVE